MMGASASQDEELRMAQGIATKVKKRKKSVLKRAAQSLQRAAVNRSNRSHVRTVVKSLRAAIASGDATAAGKQLGETISAIDRAVTKGVLEKNTANRYKSRLHVACNALRTPAKAS
jgi:small subunit ribosomal protein S20